MYDAGQYHICLQQINRVSRLKGPPAEAYDRDQLQLLRGECFVRLKARPEAFKAFRAAQESSNPKVALPARANLLTLQASPSWKFDSGSGPIDVIDPTSRKHAMSALFDAELKKAEPAIRAAQNAQSLVPIIDAVPKLKDLTALEITATGEDKVIFPQFAAVGTRARELIGSGLQALESQIASIESRANEPAVLTSVGGGPWWVSAGRRGLDSPDRDALEQAVDTASRLCTAVQHGVVISQALNGNVQVWQELLAHSSDVLTHAQNVLDAE